MTVGFLALGFGGLVLARTAQWAVGSLPSLILTETHFVFAIRDPSFWVLTLVNLYSGTPTSTTARRYDPATAPRSEVDLEVWSNIEN